jgi:pantetheine-phosphate adenylyltransferase
MEITAIYPGTFDPVTSGHLDIIDRAARLYSKVIVAVAINSNKSPLFDVTQRVKLLEEVTDIFENVSIIGFDNLLHYTLQ